VRNCSGSIITGNRKQTHELGYNLVNITESYWVWSNHGRQ